MLVCRLIESVSILNCSDGYQGSRKLSKSKGAGGRGQEPELDQFTFYRLSFTGAQLVWVRCIWTNPSFCGMVLKTIIFEDIQ